MKGLERSTLLGIILILIILGLVAILVFSNALSFVGWGEYTLTFEEACYFWSLQYYSGTKVTIEDTGETYNMDVICKDQLGRTVDMPGCPDPTCFGVPEWDDCRDLCKGKGRK